MELISDRDFSKLKQIFSKRLNLRKVLWLKFTWFKYELLTPTESKVRAFCFVQHLFVQGVDTPPGVGGGSRILAANGQIGQFLAAEVILAAQAARLSSAAKDLNRQ